MEAKKSFTDLGASTSRTQTQLVPRKNDFEVTTMTENSDPIVLKSFLQTCMNFLMNQRAIEGLQELIDNYDAKEKTQPE